MIDANNVWSLKDIWAIGGAIASVAGALSAIAFAFLQATQAELAKSLQEKKFVESDLKIKLLAAEGRLRVFGTQGFSAKTIATASDFETQFRPTLRQVASGGHASTASIFAEQGNAPIQDLVTALGAVADRDSNLDRLTKYFNATYLDDIQRKFEGVENLALSIRVLSERQRQLFTLVGFSGLSLLFLCAAVIPPIGWTNLQEIELYFGISLIFAFFGTALAVLLESLAPISAEGKPLTWYLREFKLEMMFAILASVAFIAFIKHAMA
jgi:hypothetical protein